MPIIEQFVFKRSYWKIVPLLIASLAFVASGVFLLLRSPDKWVGWMSIIFFGACALVFVWQLLDARPRLIIDDSGVFDRSLGVGVIPWSQIVGMRNRIAHDYLNVDMEIVWDIVTHDLPMLKLRIVELL